nr:hypothetical protein [Tanacetum cinerariifolium]
MIELRETFQAWLQQRHDQVVNIDSYSPEPSQCRKIPIYYDDDDDEESSTPLRDIIISKLHPCIAITPVLFIEEPKDSLIMGDEHLDTIFEKESDEFIKSSVENLVPNPNESEDLSNIGSECDVPICDDFRTFSNLLFHADDNYSSSDDKSFSDEDSFSPSPIPVEDNDSLMEEIDLSLTPDDSMPSGIKNDDYDSEGDIFFLKKLLSNDSLSLPENKSFHFDVPSSPHPPTKPPDDDEIKPDMGILIVKVPDDDLWRGQSYLGCSVSPFLSLDQLKYGGSGQAE